VLDHLAGTPLGGDRGLECFTWLGALAEATSSIELGVLVANVWNRQLGTLAVAAASVNAIAARRFWLGIGAGTAPGSRWAAEQLAVGAAPPAEVDARQARVEELLDLTDEMWRADRHDRFATFSRPSPAPPRIVGVNSVRLSAIAGRRADGVNVAWEHPRRDELLDAALAAAAGRPFVTTAWIPWSPGLLDADHPTRVEMQHRRLDRVVLTALDAAAFLDRGSG
jgi:alkanesulfonate monooxygenase SsuD/methylene tetrahydromethanopterin reductase-like flavin-dependent oxidoreductase (luciferase family)